jgi:hypothetical protein
VFAVVALGAALGAPALRRLVSRDPADGDAIALGFVLPGMLLDAGATLAFAAVFPNLAPRSTPSSAR